MHTIVEAGNCVCCGRHIDDGGHIFLCEECRRKEEEMDEYWIFTFGSGQKHAGYYVKIRGTFYEARKKMFEKYGEEWGFQYSEKEWKEMEEYPNRFWTMETLLEVIE